MLRVGDAELGDVRDQIDDVVRGPLDDGGEVSAVVALSADLLVLLASGEWALYESTCLFYDVHELRLIVGAQRASVLVV